MPQSTSELQHDIEALAQLVTLAGGRCEWSFTPFAICDAGDDKGLGVFATRQLQAGERILSEAPLVHWRNAMMIRGMHDSFAPLERIVSELDAERKRKFFAFGQCPLYGEEVGTRGIWLTNALPLLTACAGNFDSKFEAAMFATLSRFNHSCTPTCHYEWNSQRQQMTVHMVRPVGSNDELTICYLAPRGRPRSERQRLLQENFGFACGCPRCSLGGSALERSDAMQSAIGDLTPDDDGATDGVLLSSRFGAAPEALLNLLAQEGLPQIWARTTLLSAILQSERPLAWATRLAECTRTAIGSDHPSTTQLEALCCTIRGRGPSGQHSLHATSASTRTGREGVGAGRLSASARQQCIAMLRRTGSGAVSRTL